MPNTIAKTAGAGLAGSAGIIAPIAGNTGNPINVSQLPGNPISKPVTPPRGTSGDDTLSQYGTDQKRTIRAGKGNDRIFLGGDGNNITAGSGRGDDVVNVVVGSILRGGASKPKPHKSKFNVEGGRGNDTLELRGTQEDWKLTASNIYRHTGGTTVQFSGFETVNFVS